MSLQYTLTVKEGKVLQEEGYFYRAGNFFLNTSDNSFEIQFKRNKDHAVVYDVIEDQKAIQELTHPDYVPELSPGVYVKPSDIPDYQRPIYAALVKLGIAKESDYLQYFTDDTNAASFSYTVEQPQLID